MYSSSILNDQISNANLLQIESWNNSILFKQLKKGNWVSHAFGGL